MFKRIKHRREASRLKTINRYLEGFVKFNEISRFILKKLVFMRCLLIVNTDRKRRVFNITEIKEVRYQTRVGVIDVRKKRW